MQWFKWFFSRIFLLPKCSDKKIEWRGRKIDMKYWTEFKEYKYIGDVKEEQN